MNGLDESVQGPSFWKFNSNLVNGPDYCQLVNTNYNVWLKEFNEALDRWVLWVFIKYRIRQSLVSSKALENTTGVSTTKSR